MIVNSWLSITMSVAYTVKTGSAKHRAAVRIYQRFFHDSFLFLLVHFGVTSTKTIKTF